MLGKENFMIFVFNSVKLGLVYYINIHTVAVLLSSKKR